MKPLTFWDRLGRAIRDRSFIVGSVLVVLFVVVAILGPEVAPHNPFLRDRIQTIDGELHRAPFPPSELYPLGTDSQGRDMLSLLLYGARQTLVIAFVAMALRLLLGLLFGTLAGWWPGSLFDRAVTALTEFLAAIPGLILAMLLVFAVGIRRGQLSFIVALSLVGWGEVTQIIRGHVMTIRNKLFILASRAVGLSPAQLLSRHVLPNLLATLLALVALEMGAVLLLQGELGFLHIFIGGGGVYITDTLQLGQAIHYFEVPDWGAMLGTSWRYFRSLPWLPIVPALAFFVTILGFNMFGYGLQRFIEKGRFHPSGWSLLRFFAVVALVLWGARSLLASSSLEAQFAKMARQFDTQRAWNDIAYLTQPELEGRPGGPGGGFQAAGYIAHQFEQAGLTPFPEGTHFQTYTAERGRVITPPVLEVLGADGELRLRFEGEISFDPVDIFSAERNTEANLVVLGNTGTQNVVEAPSESVLLLLDPASRPPGSYYEWPWAGVLRVVPDSQLRPSSQPPPSRHVFGVHGYPSLLIGESAARQMLAEAELDLGELQETLATGEKIVLPTDLRVRLNVGLIYEETTAANVVGYLPAADVQTQGDRILVLARYTGPPPRDGEIYPGADENASGVAVMLEVIRLWREIGFEPKRTVVFAAVDEGGARHFVNYPILPTGSEDTWTAVVLQGVGTGERQLARKGVGSGLTHMFDESAHRFGTGTDELEEWFFFFEQVRPRGLGQSPYFEPNPAYSGLVVYRRGDELSGTPDDTLDHLDPQLLGEAGQTVAHYLMVLANR
ncbi:MAG: ABC transporter permease subunit [Anaerolineae bacterium]|jgi:ABC-type dipeptide/oligopeptide/nickel transport system permease subunit